MFRELDDIFIHFTKLIRTLGIWDITLLVY